ncbi:cytosine permease [Sphingomonas oryzagri]|jgi:cytosine permease|uniref:Cytosine permease n=1 Tax=Sphingomonas oryzagri TaxID=3042314 RepID=A0ABT6MY54_9SPHN|nr:cytosine permease [Sphingomonas oryzagri]MDH7637706.1 cytosine permease [Sphingomonas oryzagri]
MGRQVTADSSDQYSHSPVPDGATMAGWRVALIVASFSIGQPDFLNGAQNALALGLGSAVGAAFLAALILCIGCCFTAVVSVRTRLSTYLLVQRSFGTYGAALINIVLALVQYCAFGINASFIGEAMVVAARVNGFPDSFTAFVIAGSILAATSTPIGIRALERLALVVVPLLGIIFVTVATVALRRHGLVVVPSLHPPVPMRFGIAVTSVVGAYMIAVATMPDLSRYIRTERGAIGSMALSFPVATPLMMTVAALPALATGQTSVSGLIVSLGLGTPLLFLLATPMLTVNAANLYSGALALGATFPKVKGWMFTLLGAAIGTAFALMGIMDHFIPFLVFLSMIVPPIAAIYVIDAFTLFRHADTEASLRDLPAIRWEAIAVWIGSLVLVLAGTACGVTLTTVPALDASIVAGVGYGLIVRHSGRDRARRAQDRPSAARAPAAPPRV